MEEQSNTGEFQGCKKLLHISIFFSSRVETCTGLAASLGVRVFTGLKTNYIQP